MKLWRYGRGIERLGQRYRLDGILGSGGMADVCLAWDEREGREVAIKVMKAGELDQRTLDRFLKEAAQVAQWRHPHVLRMYGEAKLELLDAQQGSIVPYIVMEFAQGGDLHKRLTPGRPYPFADTLTIFAQLCRAVSYAHQQGVIHRDLKPLNVLFRLLPDDTEQAVLSDFGLAVEIEATHFTFAGAGTLPYMAPEQLLGYAEAASDIFALGVILYQLCTGRLPFRRSIQDLRRREPQSRPARPSSLNPLLPVELDDLIYTALAEDPRARFPDAILFARCVQAVATGVPLEAISAFNALGQQTLSAPLHRMPPRATRRIESVEDGVQQSKSHEDMFDVEVVDEVDEVEAMPVLDDPRTQPPARSRNVRATMRPNVEDAAVDSGYANYADYSDYPAYYGDPPSGTRLVPSGDPSARSELRAVDAPESRIPRRSSRPVEPYQSEHRSQDSGAIDAPLESRNRPAATGGWTRTPGAITRKFNVPSGLLPIVPATSLPDSRIRPASGPLTPPVSSLFSSTPTTQPPVSKLAPEWTTARKPAPAPVIVSPRQRKRPYLWWYLSAGVAIAAFIIFASYLAYLSPGPNSSNPIGNILHGGGATATITITPNSQVVQNSYTINAVTGTPDPAQKQIAGRALTSTSQKTQSANGTGKTQVAGATAKGQLTFFNGSFASPFIVKAGTSVTGTDGVVVVTDTELTIPVSNPNAGSDSAATVLAHASAIGAKGNIAAMDVNSTCCTGGSVVFVKNQNAFTGGQDPKNYTFIQQSDVDGVVNTVQGGAMTAAQNALKAQLQGQEQLAGDPQCQTRTTTDQAVGDNGANITSTMVTVAVTCTGLAFDNAQVQNLASNSLRDQASRQLGQGYQLVGTIVTQSTLGTVVANSAAVQVAAHGTWAYQFTDAIKHTLARAVAGKSVRDARTRITQQIGVAGVNFTGVDRTLPSDPAQIKIVVQQGAG